MTLKTKNYAPGVPFEDMFPDITLEQKLQEINATEPKPDVDSTIISYELPYDCLITMTVPPNAITAELNWLGVGSAELQGHGIASRLLNSAVSHLRTNRPEVTSLYVSSPRLGTVATMASVLGEERVTVTMGDTEYGGSSDKSLEQMLYDFPIDPDAEYKCGFVEAQLT